MIEDTEVIEILPEYNEVIDHLSENKIVFVTGGAGTGKSTLVKYLLKVYKGKVLLGAPTGIAALNINGKTIHSLCQLPPAYIQEDDIKQAWKRPELRRAELLILDEISMVNPNMLDAINAFFKKNRFSASPFGGIGVVVIGDLFQLPAIINDNVKENFRIDYAGKHKFFNAKCMPEGSYEIVELTKVFRQKDKRFVSILSSIREGVLVDRACAAINKSCVITVKPPLGSIYLCPRRAEVANHNFNKLDKINEPEFKFTGTVTGTYINKTKNDENLPAPVNLILKVGAQVMFTQNHPDKRWINGTVGTVNELRYADEMNPESIWVTLDNGEDVLVGKAQWTDYKYALNEKTNVIERMDTGSFTQYPLMLAWAVTVHKSQGQSLDKVYIDLGRGAFEVGQTYVALSRCRTLEGLSLSRPLRPSDVLVDREIIGWYAKFRAKKIKKVRDDNFQE